MNNYKIILSHPGQQHSYHSALALGDDLYKYITTEYYKRGKNLTWLFSLFACGKLKDRILARNQPEIDDKVKQFCELNAMCSRASAIRNIKLLKGFTHYFTQFGGKVADYAIRENADAVITYDTIGYHTFKRMIEKKSDIPRILDVSIGSRVYTKVLYEQEQNRLREESIMKEPFSSWNAESMEIFKNDILYADYAIAASSYVKKTLIYTGMPEDKIYIVPYGTKQRNVSLTPYIKGNRLELLFVGTINYRKGIHVLLKALEGFNENEVHLTLVGAYQEDSDIYLKYKNNSKVSFVGLVPHEKIGEIYAAANVFVLPSLSEGMARVGLEALGCGLPIICTENTGINDLITDGENGFVVPVCNEKAITDKIQWFIDHPEKYCDMSASAKRIGSEYTWERYNEVYHETVRNIIARHKSEHSGLNH